MQAPRGGPFLGKRKERELYSYASLSSSEQAAVPSLARPPPFARLDPRGKPDRPAARPARQAGSPCAKPPPGVAAQGVGGGNKLLAGYLAHEFLRCGTLLGERRLEPPPPSGKETGPAAVAPAELGRRYAEVSRLLMVGGACIPGVVNPAQLGRWLRIKE